jgi:hypothetical protein
MRYPIAILLLLTAAVWSGAAALTLKSQIDLPNVNGRIDHFSADLKNHRLFMSALGNRTVEVLEVQDGKWLHTIPPVVEIPRPCVGVRNSGRGIVRKQGEHNISRFHDEPFGPGRREIAAA